MNYPPTLFTPNAANELTLGPSVTSALQKPARNINYTELAQELKAAQGEVPRAELDRITLAAYERGIASGLSMTEATLAAKQAVQARELAASQPVAPAAHRPAARGDDGELSALEARAAAALAKRKASQAHSAPHQQVRTRIMGNGLGAYNPSHLVINMSPSGVQSVRGAVFAR